MKLRMRIIQKLQTQRLLLEARHDEFVSPRDNTIAYGNILSTLTTGSYTWTYDVAWSTLLKYK